MTNEHLIYIVTINNILWLALEASKSLKKKTGVVWFNYLNDLPKFLIYIKNIKGRDKKKNENCKFWKNFGGWSMTNYESLKIIECD